jgi:hypothetical protein
VGHHGSKFNEKCIFSKPHLFRIKHFLLPKDEVFFIEILHSYICMYPYVHIHPFLNYFETFKWCFHSFKKTSYHSSSNKEIFFWAYKKITCIGSENDAFSVSSMYKALIAIQPFVNNKYIWKMKIPLKTKVFAWYLRRGWSLLKITLQSATGMVARNVFSVMKRRQ